MYLLINPILAEGNGGRATPMNKKLKNEKLSWSEDSCCFLLERNYFCMFNMSFGLYPCLEHVFLEFRRGEV